jgi:tetratricopeptide (TPR) repeat protein
MTKFQKPFKLELEKISQLRNEGAYDEALQICNEIIDTDDACYAAYSMRSRIYYDLGIYSDAFVDLGKLATLRPHSPSAYFERATWNLELGNDQLVLNDVQIILKLGDEYFVNSAYFYLAVAQLNLGNKAEAFDAAIQLPEAFKLYVKTRGFGGRVLTKNELIKMVGKLDG